jgi:uncharacterized protein YjbI with pentapeptide repeats
MPSWAIWAGAAVLVLLAGGLMWVLLSVLGGGSQQDRIRLDVIRTAGSIVVGTGGAVALLLAARRQRSTEIALRLQDADLVQKERSAEDARHDAAERRITEIYTAAVEQLGSDKAAVRLGGLYALERLAQDNPGHRQTIVEVFCAYLRMPDPDEEPAPGGAGANEPPSADSLNDGRMRARRREEHQVRRTAQRILIDHLRPDLDDEGAPSNPKFWPDIDLDLTGATLHNWDVNHCHVRKATFSHAHFRGSHTVFKQAHFHDRTWIRGAQFHSDVSFGSVHFHGRAEFEGAYFHRDADFSDTHFHRTAWFSAACFQGTAGFDGTHFGRDAVFSQARFEGPVRFNTARFHGVRILRNARIRIDLTHNLPPGWRARELQDTSEQLAGVWGSLESTSDEPPAQDDPQYDPTTDRPSWEHVEQAARNPVAADQNPEVSPPSQPT